MGRHVASRGTAKATPSRTRHHHRGLITAAVAAAVACAATGAVLVGPRDALAMLPWVEPSRCPATTVSVAVVPGMSDVVTQILRPVEGRRLDGGGCLHVQTLAQEPLQTVSSSLVLPPDRAPDVWIPDSSLWVPRIKAWTMHPLGTLAQTPLVVATSEKAAAALGWTRQVPTWSQALTVRRTVALPDPTQDVTGLGALYAVWASLGGGSSAEKAVIGVMVSAERTGLLQPAAAMTSARSGSVKAPVLPTTEQSVIAANEGALSPQVVAVYPKGGSPGLDFPIVRVTALQPSPQRRTAVDLVTARLISPSARSLLLDHGYRTAGQAPTVPGVPRTVTSLPAPAPAAVSGLLTRIQSLAKPSRILALIDASLSMQAELSDGLTRWEVAMGAAKNGAQIFPSRASAGLWIFASNVSGNRDWQELIPVKPLGSLDKGGQNHRQTIIDLDTRNRLRPGGTALYTTVLDAVRQLRRTYDPSSVNAVVVFTDGANDDPSGPSLSQLLATLKAESDPQRPVLVYAMGIGPGADLSALNQITRENGGKTYSVNSARNVQTAFVDALSRRMA